MTPRLDSTDDPFDRLVAAATEAPFQVWDFSYLEGRWKEEATPWSYRDAVLHRLTSAHSLLDMGTGGGEFLAALAPLPPYTAATEGYPPNIPIARKRLAPLGVDLRVVGDDNRLPFADEQFDLVISRHESYDPREIRRILKEGGIFLTQQVGGEDLMQLSERLRPGTAHPFAHWTAEFAVDQLLAAGFAILFQDEAQPLTHFMTSVPWSISSTPSRGKSKISPSHVFVIVCIRCTLIFKRKGV